MCTKAWDVGFILKIIKSEQSMPLLFAAETWVGWTWTFSFYSRLVFWP